MNLNRLKKEEILWLSKHKCKHSHTYLEHPSCIDIEKPNMCPVFERIGFLDIESGGSLTADFGYVFSYCIKELDGSTIKRVLTPKEIRSYIFDKELIKDFVRDVKGFDRLIVYYGKGSAYRHDWNFLRSRAVKHKVEFPGYMDYLCTDVYDIIKAKFRFARNRMEAACDLFDIPSKAHRLNPVVWQKALAGDGKSLNYILTHNIEDCVSLEALWKRVYKFMRESKTSI